MNDTATSPTTSPTHTAYPPLAAEPDPQDAPDLEATGEVRHDGEPPWRDWGRGRTLRDQHRRRISAGWWTSDPAQSDPSYYLG